MATPREGVTIFSNPIELSNGVAAIFGRRGSGKTTLAFELVKKFKKAIVYDPRNQINEKGFTPCFNFDDFKKAIYDRPTDYKILYKPVNYKHDFPIICEYFDKVPFFDTLFMVDEVGALTDPKQPPEEFFLNIIRMGRHKRVAVLMTAQRPVDVNRNLTAECNHIFSFAQHEPRDVAYMAGFLGKDADRLINLPDYSFLYWDTKKIIVVDSKRHIMVR